MIVELVLYVPIPLLPKHISAEYYIMQSVFCAKFSLMIAGFTLVISCSLLHGVVAMADISSDKYLIAKVFSCIVEA